MNESPPPLKFSVGDRVTLAGDPRTPPQLGEVTNWREDPAQSDMSQFFEVQWSDRTRSWHHGSNLHPHVTPEPRDVIDGPANDGLEAWVQSRIDRQLALPQPVIHEARRRTGLSYLPHVARHWRAAQLEAIVHGFPPPESEVH